MGATASKPDPAARLQVIGCGMSRTGTASFSQALEILLGGPIYHGGTQLVYGGEAHMRRWIDICRRTPIKTDQDRDFVMAQLDKQISGFNAVTDIPPILFTGELVQLYPDAKVICTVRDPEKWWKSMEPITAQTDTKQRQNELVLGVVLALLPTLRYWNQMANAMRFGRFGELYYQSGHNNPHPGQYQEHMDYIQRVVPADRLHFYSVADGWEPLCKILNREVPDVPFPRINDSDATDRIIKTQLQRGLLAWASLGVSVTVAAAVVVRYWRKR